eukprot:2526212-Ditylum_brightwellii.AAC.1
MSGIVPPDFSGMHKTVWIIKKGKIAVVHNMKKISLEKETIKAHATKYKLEIDTAKGENSELTEKNQSLIQMVEDLNQNKRLLLTSPKT